MEAGVLPRRQLDQILKGHGFEPCRMIEEISCGFGR
jgi:hypothetical protein